MTLPGFDTYPATPPSKTAHGYLAWLAGLEQPPQRSTVRKIAGVRVAQCPCGYIWVTAHHRLALLFAVGHEHLTACPAPTSAPSAPSDRRCGCAGPSSDSASHLRMGPSRKTARQHSSTGGVPGLTAHGPPASNQQESPAHCRGPTPLQSEGTTDVQLRAMVAEALAEIRYTRHKFNPDRWQRQAPRPDTGTETDDA